MAGDWIKMRVNLLTDPAVKAMARALRLDPFAVVGRLHTFWSWADEHTECGALPLVTAEDIDDVVSKRGFAEQLVAVRWLGSEDGVFILPNFERHNGDSAKKRVMETEKKRRQRSNPRPDNVPEKTGQHRDNIGTTSGLEKRREEKNIHIEPEKSLLQKRAEQLHAKRPSTPWDRSEVAAWKTAEHVVEQTAEDEWRALERFYAAPQKETFARKTLAATLNNWSGEVQRALEYASAQQSDLPRVAVFQ